MAAFLGVGQRDARIQDRAVKIDDVPSAGARLDAPGSRWAGEVCPGGVLERGDKAHGGPLD